MKKPSALLLFSIAIASGFGEGPRVDTVYYAFMFGDDPAGLHAYSTVAGVSREVTSRATFRMNDQEIDSLHIVRYAEDGSVAAYSTDGETFVSMDRFRNLVHPLPTAATDALARGVALEKGARFDFTPINEGTHQPMGRGRITVEGEVAFTHPYTKEEMKLWKLNETIDGNPNRYFLVDDDRTIVLLHWNGPHSLSLGDGATARKLASELFDPTEE